jgi:hypothetical protein
MSMLILPPSKMRREHHQHRSENNQHHKPNYQCGERGTHGKGCDGDGPNGSLALLSGQVDRSRREFAVTGNDQKATSRWQNNAA